MATPTLVSLIAGPNANNAGTSSPFTQALPEPSVAGNLLLAWIFTNSGGTMAANAVTDDQAQTWTRVINGTGGTNGNVFVFKMENTLASVRQVTMAVGVVSDFVNTVLLEVFNVPASTALGITWSKEGTATNTAWDSGANQTPTAGSSIYHVCAATVQPWLSTAASTKGGSYRMECDDLMEGAVAQSWENVTATAHSPTITVATTATWLSAAVEVLAGTGGGDGSSFRVKRAVASNYAQITSASTFTYHLPTDGNLVLVDASVGNGNANISTISGATYTQHASGAQSGPAGGGTIQHFHADNVTASRTAITGTVTLAASQETGQGGVVWFRDLIGAATSPLDVEAAATGTCSSGMRLRPLTVAPTAGTRHVSVYVDHASGSEIGVAEASSVNFLIPYANQDGGSTNRYAMDSGLAAMTCTTGVTFNPTFTRGATAPGGWEALGASYKVAAAAVVTVVDQVGIAI